MAELPEDTNPAPTSSVTAAAASVSLRRTSQPRPLRVNSASLGRYRSSTAATSSRESTFLGTLTLSATGSGRRRGALREQLGQQEGRAEEPSPGGAGAAAGCSRLCLEPREHAWLLAAAEGRFKELQEVLETEPGLLLWADPISGYTLLHWLAKHGRHEELILVHDFARRRGLSLDVSAPGSGGLTPLHLAAMQGHDMVVKVLVGALGADPMRRDHSGHRACHYLRPGVSQNLRELAGAEEWEMVKPSSKRSNANNNSSSSMRALRQSSSSLGSSATHTTTTTTITGRRNTKTSSKKDSSTGGRVAQIQTLLRHMFPFFQDR